MNSSKKIGAIIVAGGLSSRMNDFKPLLLVGNKTMIETTINNFKLIGASEIVVVTGFRGQEIEETLKNFGVSFVRNEEYKTTHMFDSICIGLKELRNKVDFIFISPADSPFVQQYTLKKMIEEMGKSKFDLIQPSYENQNGHPILLKGKSIYKVLNHNGTKGLQGVISNMGADYENMAFVDRGIVLDADTTCEYLKLIEYNENKNCPSFELCEKIQDFFQMSDAVKAHSNKVAAVALNICQRLYESGIVLDNKIVMAASMLHDIAKGKTQHANVGANWIRDMGYEEISKIVVEHMELDIISKVPTEKEVVYLADKLVKDDKLVSIDERFSYKEELYKDDKTAMKHIDKRKKQAIYLYNIIFLNLQDYENQKN